MSWLQYSPCQPVLFIFISFLIMTRQIKKVIQNKLEWQLKRNEEFETCILTVSLEFIDGKKDTVWPKQSDFWY